MKDKDLEGKLVYLTIHYDRWLRDVNPEFNIPMVNRIARVIKVFDWTTQEGKVLLKARSKTKKWGSFEPKDFKYVLKVFCPELKLKGKEGVSPEEVLPKTYPNTDLLMFDVVPDWMLEELKREDYNTFSLRTVGASLKQKTKSVQETSSKKKSTTRKSSKKTVVNKNTDVSR